MFDKVGQEMKVLQESTVLLEVRWSWNISRLDGIEQKRQFYSNE